jgi:hypothetical protein
MMELEVDGIIKVNGMIVGPETGVDAGTVRLYDGNNAIWFKWTGAAFEIWVDATRVWHTNFIG